MQGLMTVFYKELADHFTSWRGIILFLMVLLVSVFAVLGPTGAIDNIREQLATPVQYGAGRFAFLYLFSTSGEGMYPFIWFIARILVPIVGIVLGLDAINSEKSSGTMSRLLSQPIYRDAVINGKFLAGVVTIAIMLTTTILLVSAIGLTVLGVAPSSEEVARLLLFWGISILYGAFWLGLAMLFSVYFQRVATSALTSMSIWIFFSFFMSMAAGLAANVLAPMSQTPTAPELLKNYGIQITASRISPIMLFGEAATVLLAPGARTAGEMLQLLHASGARWMPGPLSLGQSLLTIWPHLATIGGLTAALFAISYVKFMREEIRAT
ncbi:MAG: ABC transporter permease [Dehalococcoidia bacterium]|nr:MAG: ABC transporter permease [Dehalococcoidia bacterium]